MKYVIVEVADIEMAPVKRGICIIRYIPLPSQNFITYRLLILDTDYTLLLGLEHLI